jgi:hypothetical protein
MRIKSIIVWSRHRHSAAIVVLLTSLSVVAHAQTKSATPTDANQANLVLSRITSIDQPQPADITVGWNYIHATACQPLFDGISVWLYVFTAEGFIFSTNIPWSVNALLPACQSGNLIAVYVTDASGSVSSILVYSHK